jgi:hypothetical protein
MRRIAIALAGALALLASPVAAQVRQPPVDATKLKEDIVAAAVQSAAPDLTPYAKTADVQAKVDAVAATVPVPRTTIPMMDVIGGKAGTAGTYLPGNVQAQRISRTFQGVTTATGTVVATWLEMPAAPQSVTCTGDVTPGQALPYLCAPVAGTITTTGATMRVWAMQSVTVLGLGLAVLPAVIAPANIPVRVLAIP